MWLSNNDMELLNKVFEREDLIPKNRKGSAETEGYKLKDLSFYYSDTKAITNVCKNLIKVNNNESIDSSQYNNVLKKMALINNDLQMTEYGNKLLLILYYKDNKILNEITQHKINISNLSEEIPYIIEFFLYIVVNKCIKDRESREKNNIKYDDLAYESINNLDYFIVNIIDTLNEPTNKTEKLYNYFKMDNEDFYYFIQGINYNGYEIKRFIRLNDSEKKDIIKLFNKALNNLPANDESLSVEEKKYYKILHYYSRRQKDIRNRVKHSILNYIIFNSLRIQNSKIKFVENYELNKIISYNDLKVIVNKYDLISIANLVFLNQDSKYLHKVIKFYKLNDFANFNTSNLTIEEEYGVYKSRNINKRDKVILFNKSSQEVYGFICIVDSIEHNGSKIIVQLQNDDVLNFEKLDQLKSYIGGSIDE